MLRRAFLCFACAFALSGAVARAADEVVELPPFVVTGVITGPDWRYAEIPGYAILSQCTEAETRDIVAALWRGPQLMLPPALRPRFSLPMTVVLFNQPSTRTTSPPAYDFAGESDLQLRKWVKLIKRTLADRESYAINVWPGSFAAPNVYRFDTITPLSWRAPAAPDWLKVGLSSDYGLYRDGVTWFANDDEKTVPAAAWFSLEERQQAIRFTDMARRRLAKNDRDFEPLSTAAFLPPLPALLETAPPAVDSPDASRWASFAALFVRWGIYGRSPADPAPFWRFVERACAEPMSEALFRECFGRSYAEVHAELSWYLAVALKEEIIAPVDDMLPVPKFKLRAATETEIARLRGEWERLEAAALAPRFPDIAGDYRRQAARTFARGYKTKDGQNDPRLMASMGLLALETEQYTLAAQYLEAAVARKVPGPLPYLQAARLRWAVGRLDDTAILLPEVRPGVIDLLLQAEQQGPPLDSVYLLLARAVAQAGAPTPEQAAALERGLKFFPRQPELQQRIAIALHPAAP